MLFISPYGKTIGFIGLVDEFRMKVFDRYGQLVFATKDKVAGWDGKFKGTDLSSGIFVYLLEYTEINSSIMKMVKGTVALLR